MNKPNIEKLKELLKQVQKKGGSMVLTGWDGAADGVAIQQLLAELPNLLAYIDEPESERAGTINELKAAETITDEHYHGSYKSYDTKKIDELIEKLKEK